MRIDTDTKLWLVGDPTGEHCEIVDVITDATLVDLAHMFKGGMACSRDTVLYTDRDEAERDASGRLEAWRAYQAALRANEEGVRKSATAP